MTNFSKSLPRGSGWSVQANVELSGSGARDSNPSDRSGVYHLTGFLCPDWKQRGTRLQKRRFVIARREYQFAPGGIHQRGFIG